MNHIDFYVIRFKDDILKLLAKFPKYEREQISHSESEKKISKSLVRDSCIIHSIREFASFRIFLQLCMVAMSQANLSAISVSPFINAVIVLPFRAPFDLSQQNIIVRSIALP